MGDNRDECDTKMKLEFQVTVMTCDVSSARMEKLSRQVAGVETAEGNLLAGTMTV